MGVELEMLSITAAEDQRLADRRPGILLSTEDVSSCQPGRFQRLILNRSSQFSSTRRFRADRSPGRTLMPLGWPLIEYLGIACRRLGLQPWCPLDARRCAGPLPGVKFQALQHTESRA